MRILTIGMYGIPSGSWSNLVDADVLQDYNAIVVRPDGLSDLFERYHDYSVYRNEDKNLLTLDAGDIFSSWNNKRCAEIEGMLNKGGVVVCFMVPVWRYWIERNGSKVYITNYDWLIGQHIKELSVDYMTYGTGKTIDYIDFSHPFSKYLSTKPP
ncbi:hypothetical protein ACFLWX_03590 [Chloroflexota bacterium]